MFDFEKIKIYHYMAWKNRGLFLQKIKVFFLKKIEVFFLPIDPYKGLILLQRFIGRSGLECTFAWQAQYLVRLEGDACCSAHCKWRSICDEDQSWESFCVAGAVFGEVGGWCLLLRALEMTFHMWRTSIMRVILRGRRSIWWSWSVTFCGRRSIRWNLSR